MSAQGQRYEVIKFVFDRVRRRERCVFRLTSEGLELIEIAPGADLQVDILAGWISFRTYGNR